MPRKPNNRPHEPPRFPIATSVNRRCHHAAHLLRENIDTVRIEWSRTLPGMSPQSRWHAKPTTTARDCKHRQDEICHRLWKRGTTANRTQPRYSAPLEKTATTAAAALQDGRGCLAELDGILKDRITALKADRDTTRAALDRATGANRLPIAFDQAKITTFGGLMRERLTSGEIPFRKAYLGAIIGRVEDDDRQIRSCGRKDVLEQAVMANGGPVPGPYST